MNDIPTAMHPEIERRFLVRSFPTEFRLAAEASWVYQGYILLGNPSVRVRLEIGKPFFNPSPALPLEVALTLDNLFYAPQTAWGAWIACKLRENKKSWGSQEEWEHTLPPHMGWSIFERIQAENGRRGWLSKIRFRSGRFELDVFAKQELRDMVILEIELASAEEQCELPAEFECIEVTEDTRFSNQNLTQLSREQFLALYHEILEQKGGAR